MKRTDLRSGSGSHERTRNQIDGWPSSVVEMSNFPVRKGDRSRYTCRTSIKNWDITGDRTLEVIVDNQ